jgi:hypothetical protein
MRSIALTALFFCAACGSGGDADSASSADTTTSATTVVASDSTPALEVADTSWAVRFDGAGPLRVGMTFEEAKAALGGALAMSAQAAGPDEGLSRCQQLQSPSMPAGTWVMLEGQRVVRLDVDSGPVATVEGARIGDTEARVQQLYAGRVTVQPHKYTDGRYLVVRPSAAADSTHLLVFETDGNVVTRFRGGRRPQVEYVEGCS